MTMWWELPFSYFSSEVIFLVKRMGVNCKEYITLFIYLFGNEIVQGPNDESVFFYYDLASWSSNQFGKWDSINPILLFFLTAEGSRVLVEMDLYHFDMSWFSLDCWYVVAEFYLKNLWGSLCIISYSRHCLWFSFGLVKYM